MENIDITEMLGADRIAKAERAQRERDEARKNMLAEERERDYYNKLRTDMLARLKGINGGSKRRVDTGERARWSRLRLANTHLPNDSSAGTLVDATADMFVARSYLVQCAYNLGFGEHSSTLEHLAKRFAEPIHTENKLNDLCAEAKTACAGLAEWLNYASRKATEWDGHAEQVSRLLSNKGVSSVVVFQVKCIVGGTRVANEQELRNLEHTTIQEWDSNHRSISKLLGKARECADSYTDQIQLFLDSGHISMEETEMMPGVLADIWNMAEEVKNIIIDFAIESQNCGFSNLFFNVFTLKGEWKKPDWGGSYAVRELAVEDFHNGRNKAWNWLSSHDQVVSKATQVYYPRLVDGS